MNCFKNYNKSTRVPLILDCKHTMCIQCATEHYFNASHILCLQDMQETTKPPDQLKKDENFLKEIQVDVWNR